MTQAKANVPFTKRQPVSFKASKAVVDTSSTTATQRQGYQDFWAKKTGGPVAKHHMLARSLDMDKEADGFPSLE